MTTPSETVTETFQSEAADLSWVEFSADDRPGCHVKECDKEAVKAILPKTCCDTAFEYCVEHFEIHHAHVSEILEWFGFVTHSDCNGTFTAFEVIDL